MFRPLVFSAIKTEVSRLVIIELYTFVEAKFVPLSEKSRTQQNAKTEEKYPGFKFNNTSTDNAKKLAPGRSKWHNASNQLPRHHDPPTAETNYHVSPRSLHKLQRASQANI